LGVYQGLWGAAKAPLGGCLSPWEMSGAPCALPGAMVAAKATLVGYLAPGRQPRAPGGLPGPHEGVC
jgi:hypothetical protein